jgi:hypothetical protein
MAAMMAVVIAEMVMATNFGKTLCLFDRRNPNRETHSWFNQ